MNKKEAVNLLELNKEHLISTNEECIYALNVVAKIRKRLEYLTYKSYPSQVERIEHEMLKDLISGD